MEGEGRSESRVITDMGEGEGDSNEDKGKGEGSKIRVEGVAGADVSSGELGVGGLGPEAGETTGPGIGVQREEEGWSGKETGE